MLDKHRTFRKRFALLATMPMFVISLIFLANVATLIVLRVDVPRVLHEQAAAKLDADPNADVDDIVADHPTVALLGNACLLLAALLWPVFLVEFLIYQVVGGPTKRAWPTRLLACVCPPLRLGAANLEMDGRIWLPTLGWSQVNEQLRNRLQKIFGLPMIVIALMILPILLIEFRFADQIAGRPWLRVLLHFSTGMIWFAFALEFIIMCSVADKKLQYCKEHWLDLAIILLPLISFLRSFRVVRSTRLARLAKVQQLTKMTSKMARVYRLRGLAMKGFRALLLFEVLNRVLRITPEKRIRKLKEQLSQKELEMSVLKRRIRELEELTEDRNRKAEAKS